ncbi:alpha/beta hydrolase [Nocardia puris]|uniref:Alpha/beta hydrolase family protein n=1 Tax=Nocardia puris TaxID=208602 RepID=A0A366DH41_9NOCA|nr:alpha/beta hydrolase [Nocardia puris]MBF6213156.1 alpha/beta hydrolase [Nocardia puris]MBF6370190.1 alpha/beta hydrolase [Nocardia puris]RBO89331.1 alpha/beta hydrolase family protein [Nocardia puris]
MSPRDERHPSTVSDWDDERRKARLRETRFGFRWEGWRRTRLTLSRVAALLILALTVAAQYWVYDVMPERARLALTEPALLPVAPPAEDSGWDTAVVDMVGLGNLNAADTAAALPSLNRIGVVWAIRYDNEGIDSRVIADLIVRAAQMSGVRNIVLAGHSMGGVIALEVAEHIHRGSDRRLVAVLLDCTPMDLNAVRPESRGRGEDMLRWMGWLPGARESRTMRFAVETYARRDRFIDRTGPVPGIAAGELGEVFDEVLTEKILSHNAASNGLIHSQFLAIVGGGAVDNLRALSEPVDGKPRPAIVFLRPRVGSHDGVVDVDYSHRVLLEQVGGPDGSLLVAYPRGTGHANPRQAPQGYNEVIEAQVLPFVQRYLDRARDVHYTASPR